jgi:hypothetical protein
VKISFDRNAKWRVRIAFLSFFVSVIVLSAAAYFMADPGKFKEVLATRERLDLTAMTTKSANETGAAIDQLTNQVEPSTLSKSIDLGNANRSDLEALRNDLKTAEANATTFLPRYTALLKSERDKVETYALSLGSDKESVRRVLDDIDKRHARTTAFTSRMLLARADFYRAYQSYVAVLVSNFGAYKVIDGVFIFPLQSTVSRYNVAAQAMTVAAKRLAELEEERKTLAQSQ